MERKAMNRERPIRSVVQLFFSRPVTALRLCVIGVLLYCGLPDTTEAEGHSDRWAAIGIKLFRTTLAADRAIGDKVDDEGRLPLLLVYTDERDVAEALAEQLLRGGPIRKLPLRVNVVDSVAKAHSDKSCSPAGVFLAQVPAAEQLREWIGYGKSRGIILYSPYEGHVEQGVTAGLLGGARLQPYVNLNTLLESGIELKDFFLKVAKVYQ